MIEVKWTDAWPDTHGTIVAAYYSKRRWRLYDGSSFFRLPAEADDLIEEVMEWADVKRDKVKLVKVKSVVCEKVGISK